MATTHFYTSKNSLTTLSAETTISKNDMTLQPTATEVYIRRELAIKLAAMILEEDLITIEVDHSCADPLDNIIRARAKITIIQE